jgi:hypothetical protein
VPNLFELIEAWGMKEHLKIIFMKQTHKVISKARVIPTHKYNTKI